MSAGPIVTVEGVGKLYSRNVQENQRRISDIVFEAMFARPPQPLQLQKQEFWALKDVSFELRRGEALGVIGFNGAGKTTLLRLLSGHMLPDEGRIEIHGVSGAMIDLTFGLRDAMSGRANIYLRSSLLGRRREDVESSIDDIIAFTELGSAIDAPLASYSSGMRMRLAFATTVFMDPDFLIVDEVLSVGDFRFRQKCLERIRLMRERAAFVLVSHSMNDIARFCDRALVLEKGRIAFAGSPQDAIRFYEDRNEAQDRAARAPKSQPRSPLGDFIHKDHAIDDVEAEWLDADGREVSAVEVGETLALRLRFTLKIDVRRLIVGVPFFDIDGRMITALSTEQARFAIDARAGERVSLDVRLDDVPLTPGRYDVVAAIVDGPEFLYRRPIAPIVIRRGKADRYWGDVVLPQRWASSIDRSGSDTIGE